MEDFDLLWKFKALELAAIEQLENVNVLDTDKLFIRAKDIYDKGYEHKLREWKTFWGKEGKKMPEIAPESPQIIEKKEVEKVPDDMKTCPKCGGLVPNGWKKHVYKKDGSLCGHEFS